MDNSETTKSERLEELELYEYRERLNIKKSLEHKQNALIRDINFFLKQPLLKNDTIDPIEHTTASILPSVENIEELRGLVSSLEYAQDTYSCSWLFYFNIYTYGMP